MNIRMLKSSALVLLATLCIGCGGSGDKPKLANVTGKVIIDGKPTPNVIVMFTPEEGGRPSSGETDSSGNYRLVYSPTDTGAVIGNHSVSISANTEYTEEDLANPNIDLTKPKVEIPKEYREIKKQVEVTSGSNTIDLEYP